MNYSLLEEPDKLEKVSRGKNGDIFINKETNEKYDANVASSSFYFYQDFDVQKFFINQAYISSIVHNPAVLSLYSFDLAKSIIFTKHMPNGSLQTFLDNDFVKPNQDPCTGTNKYIILLGISFGMKYLHSQGILHLGLSPESVLLDEKYYPHISGFMKSVTNNNIPIKD